MHKITQLQLNSYPSLPNKTVIVFPLSTNLLPINTVEGLLIQQSLTFWGHHSLLKCEPLQLFLPISPEPIEVPGSNATVQLKSSVCCSPSRPSGDKQPKYITCRVKVKCSSFEMGQDSENTFLTFCDKCSFYVFHLQDILTYLVILQDCASLTRLLKSPHNVYQNVIINLWPELAHMTISVIYKEEIFWCFIKMAIL